MSLEQKATHDYEHALFKATWRKILARLKGESNELLPFEQVREQLPFRGQHYIGMKEVPVDQIIGSMGRYRDFDRAFLPRQKRTRGRWINIDKAHHADVILPPVELYKIGDIYFVIDGNHRVSVASERGQLFIDAHVIEIETPVPITTDMDMADLELKLEFARFLEETHITDRCPEYHIEVSLPGESERLLEHISVHRWYLGEQRGEEVPYEDAVVSWCQNVYAPIVEIITASGIMEKFPGRSITDLYIWIIEYLWYRRTAYKDDFSLVAAAKQFVEDFDEWPLGKLVNLLKRSSWVNYLVLTQEKAEFEAKTDLPQLLPQAKIELTVPGMYDQLFEHISVHRWYLGEKAGTEVPLEEAVVSWYDNIYTPMVEMIRDLGILAEFPGRNESDLYLWIIERQAALQEIYGEVTVEKAAEQVVEDHAGDVKKKPHKGSGLPDRQP
jgi:hypothetical protein